MSDNISNNLEKFIKDVASERPVVCSGNGEWRIENCFIHFVKWLFGFDDYRIANVVQVFNKHLDKLEKIPVEVSGSDADHQLTTQAYADAADVIRKAYHSCRSKSVKQALRELDQRIVAQKYRMNPEAVNSKTVASTKNLRVILDAAQDWRNGYKIDVNKTFHDKELEVLEKVAAYSDFVDLLRIDRGLRDLFFKWSLRDGNDPEAFIKFPKTTARIKNAYIAGRIGRFSRYKFVNVVEGKQVFQLPFHIQDGNTLEKRNISILDESAMVNLKGDYQVTIKKVIDTFANKNKTPGDIDYFEPLGLCNWNSFEWGFKKSGEGYDRIDFSKEKWWEQLPTIETFTPEQMIDRYNLEEAEVTDGKWFAVARSSRESNSMNIERTHGFFEMLIPNDNGTYSMYPFGKYAKEFPTSLIEKCLIVSNTVEGRMQYPDENHAYGQRQQASYALPMTMDQGNQMMDKIRESFDQGIKGNLIFQFSWENCAWMPQAWLEEILGKEKVPNFFLTHIFNSDPGVEPLKTVFTFARSLSKKNKRIMMKIIEFFFLSWRGITVKDESGKPQYKSMATSLFQVNNEVFHPATLHEKILKSELSGGRVTLGNFFRHQIIS